jgi:hypothetical protein
MEDCRASLILPENALIIAREVMPKMSEMGLVSRVLPVNTAVRNLYERRRKALRGRQSGVDLKPPQAAVVKSDGRERCGNAGTRFRQARLREASASKPSMKCRKRIRRCQNRGVTLPPGSAWEVSRRPKRHPAYRRREAQPGFGTERENLIGDAKGILELVSSKFASEGFLLGAPLFSSPVIREGRRAICGEERSARLRSTFASLRRLGTSG